MGGNAFAFPVHYGGSGRGCVGLELTENPRVFFFAKVVRDRAPFVITISHQATGLSRPIRLYRGSFSKLPLDMRRSCKLAQVRRFAEACRQFNLDKVKDILEKIYISSRTTAPFLRSSIILRCVILVTVVVFIFVDFLNYCRRMQT